MTIKTKATTLSIIVFFSYILILPIFGIGIDFQESLFFYSVPCFIFLDLQLQKTKPSKYLTPLGFFIQTLLIILALISTIFSLNIGISIYALFNLLTIILVFNLYFTYYSDQLPSLSHYLVYVSIFYSVIFTLNKIGFLPILVKPLGDNFILQVWGHSNLGNLLIFPLLYTFPKLNNRYNQINLFVFIFLSIVLFLTNSRTSIFSLAIGLLVLKPANNFQKNLKTITLFISIGTLLFLFINSPPLKTLTGNRDIYWSQGLIGFTQSPIIGNGLDTFVTINRQLLNSSQINSNSAHNSIINSLTDSGIIFTTILFAGILYALFYQSRHNNLLFALGSASFICSLLDVSWKYYGIFIIALIIIFQDVPYLFTSKKSFFTPRFIFALTILIFVFFCLKTTSDFLYLNKKYELSLKFDPFNLNSRLANINYDLPTTLKLFHNETLVYQKLINTIPLPQSQPFYAKLISLDPSNSSDIAIKLAESYLNTNSPLYEPFILKLLTNRPKIHEPTLSYFVHELAKKTNSLYYYQKTVDITPRWGTAQIDLAKAYWNNLSPIKFVYQLTVECPKYPDPKQECYQYLDNILIK